MNEDAGRISRAWSIYLRLLPGLFLLFLAVSVTALSIASWIAVDRANDAGRQNKHLADLFCGLVEPIGEAATTATTTVPRSPLGTSLATSAKRTSDALRCPHSS